MLSMQVGIWIRVSTEEQAQGESPKNHEHRARMYAELKNWDVVQFYDLSGVSGKSVIEHPEAKRMLADVADGKIKALIFSKLARLARNVKELLDISDHFQKYQSNLVSLEESIDTSTPAGRLLFTVIGALAQWEREEISARVAASVPIRARQGKNTGGTGSFGYHWVEGSLIVNPQEAPTVKEIFKTFLETKKLLTTAKLLNDKGYRSRNGAKFGKTTVKRILTDPIYKGTKRANYSKSKGEKKSWKLKPQSEWVYFQVEPLIDEKTWNEINAIIKQNASPFPATPPPIGKYAFSGLLTCGNCNKPMYVLKYDGMKIPRYACRNCKQKINEDVLFDSFQEGLRCMVVHPEQLNEAVKDNDNAVSIQDKEAQLKTIKSELRSIDKKVDGFLDLLNDGVMERALFKERIKDLHERKDQLEKNMSELEAEIAYIKTSTLGKDFLLTQATTLYSLWDTISYENRVKIVRELLSGIVLKEDALFFEYFYLPEFT